jgi:hypothetical protein
VTNPKRGELRLEMAGQTFNCKINMDVIMRMEVGIGKSILKLANTLQGGDMTTADMVAFLTPVLRSSGDDLKDKDVQKLVWEAGLTGSLTAVAEVITFIITGNDNEGNEQEAASA